MVESRCGVVPPVLSCSIWPSLTTVLEVTTLVKSAVLSLNLVTMWTTFLAVRIASDSLAVSSARLDEVDGLPGSLEVSMSSHLMKLFHTNVVWTMVRSAELD